MFIYTGVLFPVRSDCLDFDSSTPEGMRGVLGAELKFMGHDRKLSLLPPAPPQPHRERACMQARRLALALLVLNFKTLPFTACKQQYRAPASQASTLTRIYSQPRRVRVCLLYETSIWLDLFTNRSIILKEITPYLIHNLLRFRISFLSTTLWVTIIT